jgi:hypothetical protein
MTEQVPIAKFAVQVVASIGVSKVVNDIIKNNTTILTQMDNLKVGVGSLVIGSMIADQTMKNVSDRYDSVAAWYANRKANSTEK